MKIFCQRFNKTERFTVHMFYACTLGYSSPLRPTSMTNDRLLAEYYSHHGAVKKYYLKCHWIRTTRLFYRFITGFRLKKVFFKRFSSGTRFLRRITPVFCTNERNAWFLWRVCKKELKSVLIVITFPVGTTTFIRFY